jgi:SRSO17 transposase
VPASPRRVNQQRSEALYQQNRGLDHYQVRGYRAWYSHTTRAMLAAAYLAATRAQEAKKGDSQPAATC